MSAGTTISRTFSSILKGSIHKRRLLKGGGRVGGQKCRNLLSKKTTKGEGEGHKIGKMGRRRLWMAPHIYTYIGSLFNEFQIVKTKEEEEIS